jgi:hypothetical protein
LTETLKKCIEIFISGRQGGRFINKVRCNTHTLKKKNGKEEKNEGAGVKRSRDPSVRVTCAPPV